MQLRLMNPKRIFFPLLIFLAAAGIVLILVATRWGAALSDDSYYYIKPARDILAGRAFALSAHYAPGLPFVLAGIGFLGIDPQAGIRLLNALCFGVNIFLSGLLVRKITRREGFGLAAALLVLLAQPMIEVHAWAMSEALFLTFLLGALSALGQYLEKRHLPWLLGGAVLAGLCGLTRYAGASMVIAGGLALLLLPGQRFLRRARDAGLYGLLGGGIYAIYPLLSQAASGQVGSMTGFKLAPLSQGSLTDLLYNTLLWLMPGRLARGREALVMGAVIALGILLAALFAALRRAAFQAALRDALAQPLLLVLALFAAVSLFVLYQANLSEVYKSPFDFRLLSPTHLALLLLLVSLLGLVWAHSGRWIKTGLVIVFVLTAGVYASRALDTVQLYASRGMGFASSYWYDSDVVRFMRRLPAGTPLVTTAPMGVYFSTGRETAIFTAYSPEALAAALHENGGYFILFNSMPFEIYGTDGKAYIARLQVAQKFGDATAYQAP